MLHNVVAVLKISLRLEKLKRESGRPLTPYLRNNFFWAIKFTSTLHLLQFRPLLQSQREYTFLRPHSYFILQIEVMPFFCAGKH